MAEIPCVASGKETACPCRRCDVRDVGWTPVGEIPWRRERQPTPVFFPGEFHGQRSLAEEQSVGLQRVRHD